MAKSKKSAKEKEWMTWKDGETVKSVKLSEVIAIVQRKPPRPSLVVVRGGGRLEMDNDSAAALRKAIGAK